MSAIRRPDLLARAHIEQTLVELLSHLIGREVHILAMSHKLAE